MRLSALRAPLARRISLSRSISCPSAARRRSFHGTAAPANDPDIVTDSLRKTLDAHRTSNRARLIRKVYPKAPAAGLWRPRLSPENYAGYQPPTEAAAPPPEENEQSSSTTVPHAGRQRRRSRTSNRDVQPLRSRAERSRDDAIRSAESLPTQQPWLAYGEISFAHREPTAYLDAEIRALDRYLAPTRPEQEQVDQVIAEVCSLLEAIVPCIPQVIGSRRTGLALAHSGLDFILPVEDLPRSLDRARRPSASRPQILDLHDDLLRRVKSALERRAVFGDPVHRSGKRPPILSLKHQHTGLSLYFYCGEAPPAIIEYLQDYQAEYPALRPLYMATRALLEAHALFGPAHSGIGSDALALLLVAFLKLNHGRYPGASRLGDQLLAFLRLFSADINLQTVGVAVDPPGFFSAETLRTAALQDPNDHENAARPGQRSLVSAKRTAAAKGNRPVARRLCIQDPTHYMNDLGRSCTRVPELQDCFAAARDRLSRVCDSWTTPDSVRSSSILAAALQANFGEFERLRQTLRCGSALSGTERYAL